jgi:hypothetical protein
MHVHHWLKAESPSSNEEDDNSPVPSTNYPSLAILYSELRLTGKLKRDARAKLS